MVTLDICAGTLITIFTFVVHLELSLVARGTVCSHVARSKYVLTWHECTEVPSSVTLLRLGELSRLGEAEFVLDLQNIGVAKHYSTVKKHFTKL